MVPPSSGLYLTHQLGMVKEATYHKSIVPDNVTFDNIAMPLEYAL